MQRHKMENIMGYSWLFLCRCLCSKYIVVFCDRSMFLISHFVVFSWTRRIFCSWWQYNGNLRFSRAASDGTRRLLNGRRTRDCGGDLCGAVGKQVRCSCFETVDWLILCWSWKSDGYCCSWLALQTLLFCNSRGSFLFYTNDFRFKFSKSSFRFLW